MGLGGGFFAGGMAQGFGEQTQQQNLATHRQDELKLQQQGQQNAQKRFEMTQADGHLKDLWSVLDDYVQHAKIVGTNPTEIAKHSAGLLQGIEKFEVSSGRSQPGMVSAKFATLLAKPSKTDTTEALTKAGMKPTPIKTRDESGAESINVFNPKDNTVTGAREPSGFDDANQSMKLSPQEQSLYRRHLTNLSGSGGVDNPDGSRSSLYAVTARFGDRSYIIPTVRDGKILEPKEAIAKARADGLDNFPSYGSDAEAKTRYDKMHDFMERDTERYQRRNQAKDTGELPPPSESGQKLGFKTGVSSKAQQLAARVGMTGDQIDFAAVREAHGDTTQSSGFGGSKAGAAMRTIVKSRANQYWMDKGLEPQEANATVAEFQAMKRGATTVAQMDARMTVALGKAKATAPVLLDISSKVNRSQYPDIASIQLALQKRIGTKEEQGNLARFNIAIETMASNYGSTLGMGNSVLTDFQTKRAQSLLEHAYSDGTLNHAVDQMLLEIDREEKGTRGAMHTFFGGSTTTSSPAGGKDETRATAPTSKPTYTFNPSTGELE